MAAAEDMYNAGAGTEVEGEECRIRSNPHSASYLEAEGRKDHCSSTRKPEEVVADCRWVVGHE